jgi:hypothetical protein
LKAWIKWKSTCIASTRPRVQTPVPQKIFIFLQSDVVEKKDQQTFSSLKILVLTIALKKYNKLLRVIERE